MAETLGTFSFVLHSHIPYVLAHGRSPHGTDWLSEAAAETYLPLLDVCHRLVAEGLSPKITLGLTPVLVEQLRDPSFQDELSDYLRGRRDAAAQNQEQFRARGQLPHGVPGPLLGRLVRREPFPLRDHLRARHRRRVRGPARRRPCRVITSSATHGYSALLSQDTSIQAQVKQGIAAYKRHFGRDPRGYWLPECSYRPRYHWARAAGRARCPQDPLAAQRHGRVSGRERHRVLLRGRQPAARRRDPGRLRRQVRPPERALQAVPEGNGEDPVPPLHPLQTLPRPFIRRPRHPPASPCWGATRRRASRSGAASTAIPATSGTWSSTRSSWKRTRQSLGLRYWRICQDKADIGAKRLYEPHQAEARTRDHAAHFVPLVKDVLRKQNDPASILCAVYDTELYGHWWFEGPQWLYHVLKQLAQDPEVTLATVSEYLDRHPATLPVDLPEGSWGEGGFHYIWLNEETAWSWKLVYEAEAEMSALAHDYGDNAAVAPILKQAAREALLLMASDWQFCHHHGRREGLRHGPPAEPLRQLPGAGGPDPPRGGRAGVVRRRLEEHRRVRGPRQRLPGHRAAVVCQVEHPAE